MDTIDQKYIMRTTIGNMKPGDSGYCVPWAMYIDRTGKCYLRTGMTLHKEAHGTASMPVERNEDGDVVVTLGFNYFGGQYDRFEYSPSIPPSSIPVNKLIQ